MSLGGLLAVQSKTSILSIVVEREHIQLALVIHMCMYCSSTRAAINVIVASRTNCTVTLPPVVSLPAASLNGTFRYHHIIKNRILVNVPISGEKLNSTVQNVSSKKISNFRNKCYVM